MLVKVYVSNALPIAVKIIGGLIILRVFIEHLGMEGFGIAAQYQSIVTLAYGVVNALVFNYIVKTPWNGTSGDDEFGVLLQWIFRVSLIAAFFVALLSYPLAYLVFNDGRYYSYICIAVLTLPLIAIYVALSAKMCGDKLQASYNLISAASTAIAILLVCLSTYWVGISGALIALGCFYIPAFALQAFVNRKQLIVACSTRRPAESYDSRPLLKFAFVGVLSAGLAVLIQIVIRNNIAAEVGWIGVGEWQTVNKISESYLMLASIPLFTYFLPRYSSLSSSLDRHSFLVKTLTFSLLIVACTGVAIYLSWNSLVVLVIGSQFGVLGEVFKIQVLGDVFKIVSWVFVAAALARNRIKQIVILELLFAMAYCVLSYYLIPVYKINGAIIGYVIAYVLFAVLVIAMYVGGKYE